MGWLKTSLIVLVTAVVVVKLPVWFEESRPVVFGGKSSPGWEKVGEAFKKNVHSGLEKGGAFAVYHKGELVAQYYGGYADAEASVPWTQDTVTIIFSSSKFLGVLIIAMLVDKGLLDYDQPVSKYWPEFAANGKKDVTVEQLMSHQAGLAYLDEKWALHESITDPDGMGRKLASTKPKWTPGTKHGYHGLTIGLYAEQLLRHVDPKHRDVSQFFEEEVAKPFGLDIWLGLPKEENFRCARVVPASELAQLAEPSMWPFYWKAWTQPDSSTAKMMDSPEEFKLTGAMNSPHFRTATNPSAMGFASATSLGKLMGIVANGGQLKGKKLISPKTIDRMSQVSSSGTDEVLTTDTAFGLGGFLLKSPTGSTMIGHPGAGGQMAYADLEHDIGVAYITNYMSVGLVAGDDRYTALKEAVYEAHSKLK